MEKSPIYLCKGKVSMAAGTQQREEGTKKTLRKTTEGQVGSYRLMVRTPVSFKQRTSNI
jgi:hypothetical protein